MQPASMLKLGCQPAVPLSSLAVPHLAAAFHPPGCQLRMRLAHVFTHSSITHPFSALPAPPCCSYLFTYLDASPSRPSLEALLEQYWRAMPEYQGVKLEDLQARRQLGLITACSGRALLCLLCCL